MRFNSRLDAYFRSLSHPYRRYVVRRLREDGSLEVTEIATDIASRDTAGETDEEAVERVHVLLNHSHLPKLSDSGVIDFDPEDGRVSPTEVTGHLAAIVEIGISVAEAGGDDRND